MPKTPTQTPHLLWLRSFEASARHLNFTQAAHELGLTQAAISKHIKHLEQSLGAPLFERKARSLELTNAGRAYLPKVQDGFNRLMLGTQEVFGKKSQRAVTIRVIASFASQWLIPRLAAFYAQYPEIELRIFTSNWAESVDVDEFDLDIRYGTGNWRDWQADPLCDERLYPLASRKISENLITYSDLLNYPIVNVIGFQEGWHDWFKAAEMEGQPFQNHHVDSSIVAYEMARAGLAIALGRRSLCQNWEEQGWLYRPFDLEIETKERFYLLCKTENLTREAHLLREWILIKR